MKKQIVYAGQRINSRNQTYELFFSVNEDGTRGDSLTFTKSKSIKGYAVGHVYSIEHDEDGSAFRFGTTEYVGSFADKDQVRKWQAEYQADRVSMQAAAYERKHARNDSALEESVEQLRRAYSELHPTQRVGFEVWLLSKVRQGT